MTTQAQWRASWEAFMGGWAESTSNLDVAQMERARRLRKLLLNSINALCEQQAGGRAPNDIAYRLASELAEEAVARADQLSKRAAAVVDTDPEAPPRVLTRENAGETVGPIERAQMEANARPLKTGDVVELKSGGPTMTLGGHDNNSGWQRVWFDWNTMRELWVRDLAALKRA